MAFGGEDISVSRSNGHKLDMVSGSLLVLFLILLMCPHLANTCGPGFTTQKPGSNLYVRSRQPDVPEDSVSASGKFEHALKMDDERLVRISSTQIEFTSKKRDAKCRMATKVFHFPVLNFLFTVLV